MFILLNRPLFQVSIIFPVASRMRVFRSNKRERNEDNLKSIVSVPSHKIFTKNFHISIALLLIQSSGGLKKIKSWIKY